MAMLDLRIIGMSFNDVFLKLADVDVLLTIDSLKVYAEGVVLWVMNDE